jgi:hypothetical protein
MNFSLKQLCIWATIALIITFAGVWFGEIPAGFGVNIFVIFLSLPVIIALMFLLNLIIKQKWFVHFFVGFAFFGLFVAANLFGADIYHYAFNDCVNKGENVRLALRNFYVANKSYPKSLADLKINLPGNLIFHPNILQYKTTKQGYLLRFDDNFIAFEATESTAFEANK